MYRRIFLAGTIAYTRAMIGTPAVLAVVTAAQTRVFGSGSVDGRRAAVQSDMVRTILYVAVFALACLPLRSAATSSSLTLPAAIQNGFRIGSSQPNAQGIAGFSIQGLGFDAAGNMYLAGTNMGGPFAASNQTSI